MASIQELKDTASQIRRDIVRMVHAVQSGHPGGSLGCTEFFTALYFHTLQHNTQFNMNGTGEDLFFLSNGHISPVYYSALARSGYFDIKELNIPIAIGLSLIESFLTTRIKEEKSKKELGTKFIESLTISILVLLMGYIYQLFL